MRVAALLVENFVYSCALFTPALGDSQGELSALYDLKYREKNSLNKATKGGEEEYNGPPSQQHLPHVSSNKN